jgi:hypothetical protein
MADYRDFVKVGAWHVINLLAHIETDLAFDHLGHDGKTCTPIFTLSRTLRTRSVISERIG